jgi:4-amino-4-deoxychorismate lyase
MIDAPINNINQTLDISDRGLAYGDGLFETIAYVNGMINNWDLHWQRLVFGAKQLQIELPDESFFLEQMNAKIEQHISITNIGLTKPLLISTHIKQVIKIIVTRGQGGRGYLYPQVPRSTILVTVYPWPIRSEGDYLSGIHVVCCQTCLAQQPALAGIKHLNRLEQVLARNEFSNTEYQEGIMFACSNNSADNHLEQSHSLLIEGTSSNLFFVNNNQLITPIIDNCGVRGTIRARIFLLAKSMGINVIEKKCYLQELQSASALFFTNSIYGILPVASVMINSETSWFFDVGKQKIPNQLAKIINNALNWPTKV